jgi:hypothetical protein
MLSVVLYGRNDAHGYNLHKRGALSLNCIAEVLTEDDDELIFVDYNTPDELPTFPEALADTLTAQARRRLRIIRVRGDYHRQFAGQTRLVALECQSRNIAIRRSNPNNRWVLSTNTDMIFCPRGADSLSAVVAGLGDGFYHNPRFELPEGFWERLNRMDPRAAIAAMRRNGRRFHLNEVVYGLYDNVYEGPGDFQLFLRQDLFEVQGFDERMMLGWHADANMARRMRLLRGKVSSVFPEVAGYHCGHTRQATSLHKGGRTENSPQTYVIDVSEARAPWQTDTWGAPGVTFEEVRLDAPDLYFPALSEAVRAEGPEFSEASIEDTFHKVPYEAQHVLPHLCDVVFNLPPDQTIFFFGDDGAIAEGLRDFLEAAGRRPRFLLAQECPAPRFGHLACARWEGAGTTAEKALEAASLFVIQHPSADLQPEEDRSAQEWWCHRLLTHLAELERCRPVEERRRVVVINGVHNGLSPRIEMDLAPTSMPFSTRLRQGFFIDPRPPVAADAAAFGSEDLRTLSEAAAAALAGAPEPAWAPAALEIRDVCLTPAAPDLLGATAEAVERLRCLVEGHLQAVRSQSAVPLEDVLGDGYGARLCSPADWRRADWLARAQVLFGAHMDQLRHQSRSVWEPISLLQAVIDNVPPPQNLLISGDLPRVLVIAEAPDLLVPILAHYAYEVRYATWEDLLQRRPPDRAKWRERISAMAISMPPHHAPLALDERARFDAVVMPRRVWFEHGYETTEALMAALEPLVKPGALFAATAQVNFGERLYSNRLSLQEWRALFEPEGALGSRGFTPAGRFEPAVTLACLARRAVHEQDGVLPGLSFDHGDAFDATTIGLFCALWPAVSRPGFPYRRAAPPEPADVDGPYWRLGRGTAIVRADRETLKGLLRGLQDGEPAKGWQRLAPEIAAIASSGPATQATYGLDGVQARHIRQVAEQTMREALARGAAEPINMVGRPLAPTRLCSGADWEDPAWLSQGVQLFDGDITAFGLRSSWIWEQVSMVHAVRRRLPAQNRRGRVLVLAPNPHPIAHLLAHFGIEVTAVTVPELLGQADEGDGWRAILDRAWLRQSAPVRRLAERPDDYIFDAVVATHQSLLEHDTGQTQEVLQRLSPRIAAGGSLHAAFSVQLNTLDLAGAVGWAKWRGLYAEEGPLGARGFRPLGDIDTRIPMDTVIRFSFEHDDSVAPGLSWGYGTGLVSLGITSALWPEIMGPAPLECPTCESEPFDPAGIVIPYIASPSED